MYGSLKNDGVTGIDKLGKSGCRGPDRKPALISNNHGSWVPECTISIFVGHNSDVPQDEIGIPFCSSEAKEAKDEERQCGGSMTISCGNLDPFDEAPTHPAPSTIPDAPTPPELEKINGITVDSQLKDALKLADEYAEKIYKRKCCKCKVVTVIVHYSSDLPWTLLTNEKGTERRHDVKSK
ncbi:MAG: hypothetical protein WCK77_19300 [Verrucomicrobiota bacterium]